MPTEPRRKSPGDPETEAAPADFCFPASILGLLRAAAGDEMFAAAIPFLRAHLKLTPEKLALILVRLINPDERIEQGEEALLRGVRTDTLTALKGDSLFAREINGLPTPVPRKAV